MKNRAFTLIEVLVAASIISLLAAIVFASVDKSRAKAAEVKALAESRQMQSALELYRSSYNSYPTVNDASDTSSLESALVPNYIPSLPESVKIGDTANLCPNIRTVQYISKNNVAKDNNWEYKCGPGVASQKPDEYVVLVFVGDKDIPDENKPYVRRVGFNEDYYSYSVIRSMQLNVCAPGATCPVTYSCAGAATPPGSFLIGDGDELNYYCISS